NILNREKHPEWNGERTKMVYRFPANEKLWAKYAEIRAESLRIHGDLREATAFYLANRAALDEGAEVAWPERFNHDEASAVQHAMNLKLQDEAAFFAEYQNEPLPEKSVEDEGLLTADQIAQKLNGHRRGEVPIGVSYLTMFVDVQGKLLFWMVCGWQDDFTGYVLDYGAYPDQRRRYFTLRDAQRTLQIAAKGAGIEGAIYAGLEAVAESCMGREWRRDDGAAMRIGLCMIDANWGTSTDVVYQFCRQSAHAAVLLPSHGRFVGAASRPFREYSKRPGDRLGLNWYIPGVQGKRAIRHVTFDSNWWKSFVHARLAVAMGDKGCLSLFGRNPEEHRLLADHLTSEYRVKTEGRGRVVDEWRLRPEASDNHWLDCLVGCAVAASVQGAILPGTDERPAPKGSRVRLSELQKGRR
ncbi:MAG: phage terminase large subunit family protein, partial [Planctomycetota bacterium]|nr:phage terminase large subunit family protein [Planctomycetota bacterium]